MQVRFILIRKLININKSSLKHSLRYVLLKGWNADYTRHQLTLVELLPTNVTAFIRLSFEFFKYAILHILLELNL